MKFMHLFHRYFSLFHTHSYNHKKKWIHHQKLAREAIKNSFSQKKLIGGLQAGC